MRQTDAFRSDSSLLNSEFSVRSGAAALIRWSKRKMFRKFLKMLRKVDRHPCFDWPSLEIDTPELNTGAQRIGDLRVGSAIAMARPLGAPDLIEPVEDDAINLIYAKAGFQLEFTRDMLSSVAYFVAEDRLQPDTPALRFSEPVIDSHKLTRSHDAVRLQELFGSPQSVDEDADETILFYKRDSLTIDFELGVKGTLRRVNVYVAD